MSTGATGGNAISYGTTGAAITSNSIGSASSVIANKVYAIQAYGGYSTAQTFDNITRLPETLIGQFDVTGALEVLLDVRMFNMRIGIHKDTSNVQIITPVANYYNLNTNMLLTDAFTISAAAFIKNLNVGGDLTYGQVSTANVVSVGVFSTIYSDFAAYVSQYFGFASVGSSQEEGFATLFSGEYGFNPNQGVFDASAFCNLLHETDYNVDTSGAKITGLSGSVTVAGITQLLRNAVDQNPFGNRNPATGTTAGDPADRANYGVTDGFYADDLFFIPNNGFSITLNLNIDQEAYTNPLNNTNVTGNLPTGPNPLIGTQQTTAYNAESPAAVSSNGGTNVSVVSSSTTATTTLIQRVINAPLLIRLANLTLNEDSNFYDYIA